jgi:hemerythrin superfamily protein
MNVITLLTKDHRKVESLFERYRSLSTPQAKQRVLDQVSRELSVHMAAEERELYPLLRRSISDGSSRMEEAEKEHSEAKASIADLMTAEPGTFDMDAKVATLMKAIQHHVSEEEGEIFPKMKESFDRARLAELGRKIVKAKSSAPELPPRSAARRASGPSIRGMAAAATDRIRNLFALEDERSGRKEPKRARRRRKPARRKTTTAAKAKRVKRSRARRRA